eukprot:Partr_v1_DN29000_c0_g1_i4_m25180 putative Nuclear RNA export factor
MNNRSVHSRLSGLNSTSATVSPNASSDHLNSGNKRRQTPPSSAASSSTRRVVDDQPEQRRKSNNYNHNNSNSKAIVTITCAGSDDFSTIDERALISWLIHKARRSITVVHKRFSKSELVLTLEDESMARALMRVDGFTYRDRILKVSVEGSALPTPSTIPAHLEQPEVVSLMQEFVKSRFTFESKMLDFSNVASVPMLMAKLQMMNTAAWSALFKAAQSVLHDGIDTISFNQNNLRTLYPLAGLKVYLPNVKNLSFAGNSISDIKTITEVLSGLAHLREIVFTGNAVAEDASRKLIYRKAMASAFPSLEYLDSQAVERSTVVPPVPSRRTAALPAQPLGSFFDSEVTRNTVAAFLTRYMDLFDGDRSALKCIYTENSVFSHIINGYNPMAVYGKSLRTRTQEWSVQDLDMSLARPNRGSAINWKDGDRNLIQRNASDKSQLIGIDGIISHFHRLPVTKHKNPSSFLVDSWQISMPNRPPQLFINVHGAFDELSKSARTVERWFDRLFILRPCTPGSEAERAGWPVVVMNDMLIVRPSKTDESYRRLVKIATSPAMVEDLAEHSRYALLPHILGSTSTTPHNGSTGQNMSDQQRMVVMQFSKETGLNPEFSYICLVEQSWNVARAMEVFIQARNENRIPPQAFSVQ